MDMDTLLVIFLNLLLCIHFHGIVCQNVQRYKSAQADFESEVLLRIAEGKKTERGDAVALHGALDEEYGGDDLRNQDNYNDDDEGMIDSFLVQKLQNSSEEAYSKSVTTYHSFDDPSYRSPLFRRSGEDYKADFIIFANPSFPPGTGHYVVLRRLEAPNHPLNYDIEDDLSAEDADYNDKQHDYDDEESGFWNQLTEGLDEGVNPRTPEPPGRIQSGEENYADTEHAGHNEDGVGNDNDEYGDDVLAPKSPFKLKIQRKASFPTEDDDPPMGQGEIIYEAFSINFKGSLQGYISDMDPLQYSFLKNEVDPVESLMEDDNNLVQEGDDDRDTEEENEANEGGGADANEMQNEMDLNSDRDFMNFENSIKQDTGMMSTGGEVMGDGENDAEEEESRKKRSVHKTMKRKVVISTSSSKRRNKKKSVKWKGCLRRLSLNDLPCF